MKKLELFACNAHVDGEWRMCPFLSDEHSVCWHPDAKGVITDPMPISMTDTIPEECPLRAESVVVFVAPEAMKARRSFGESPPASRARAQERTGNERT